MDNNAKVKQTYHSEDSNNHAVVDDLRALGRKKIFAKGHDHVRFHYNPSEAPSYVDEHDPDTKNSSDTIPEKASRSKWFKSFQILGVIVSSLWALICTFYFIIEGGLVTQTPYEMGIFIAGMTAPVAFFWMVLSYFQRNSDVKYYAENLRAEMHSLFFPSEEDSLYVNKDIERMSAQAAELAMSSKAVLKSIQKTRHGLRNEIKEFSNFARIAESHLISLSDNLVERTGNVAGMVETIEQRMGAIESRSQSAVLVWDEASARMVERASDIEIAMEQGADRILAMSEIAQDKSNTVSKTFESTITSLGFTVDAIIDRLGNINEEFSGHTRTLKISSEELSRESDRIGSMINEHVTQLQNAAGYSVESISESLVAVSNQKDLLVETADILTSRTYKISETIDKSLGELTTTSDVILTRTENAENRLNSNVTKMSSTIECFENKIAQIEKISEVASDRFELGIEKAVDGSNQVGLAVNEAVNILVQTSKTANEQALELIETTVAQIQQLKISSSGNVDELETIVELLERSRTKMELATSSAASQGEALVQTVDLQSERFEVSALSLTEHVKSVAQSLEEPIEYVTEAINKADNCHAQIQTTFEHRVEDLNKASDKAKDTVEVIRRSLREQTNAISSLSGSVVSQSKILNTELLENKIFLTETIEHSLNQMTRLIDGITENSSLITGNSDNIIESLSTVSENLKYKIDNLNDSASDAVQSIGNVSDKFITVANSFENKLQSTEKTINNANNQLLISSEKILPLYEKVDVKSADTLNSLNNIKQAYTDITDNSLSAIDQAITHYDNCLSGLKTGSEDAYNQIKSSSEKLTEKLEDINYAAETATDQMFKLSCSMKSQSSDIQLVTDQASTKIENIQKLMSENVHELSMAVGLAVNQIDEVGSLFDAKATKINDSANIIMERFATAGDTAYEKAFELKQATYHIAQASDESVSKITKQLHVLDERCNKSLSTLLLSTDNLSNNATQIDSVMQSVLDQTKAYSTLINTQLKEVAKEGDNSANKMSASVSSLLCTMDEVSKKTQTVVDNIQDSNLTMYEQSGKYVLAVSNSALAAEKASTIFSSQADNLLKASKLATKNIEDIQKMELRAGRENFFSSMRFVLESLHSISIDFVRMIDGEVSEKDWKSYNKGEVALFTSKVVNKLDKMPSDKIRYKYEDDVEFRNYVHKFMRQFEDILDQANTVDRGAILGATFAASDVGKIYHFLCNITGKSY